MEHSDAVKTKLASLNIVRWLTCVFILVFTSQCLAEINSVDAEFPAKPSLVPDKLLGVKRENWKTFSYACSSLDQDITLYSDRDRWGTVQGVPQAKINWKDCLEAIKTVKTSLVIYADAKKKVEAIRGSISKETGKKFPLNSLNWGISLHVNNEKRLDKTTLYAIDVYGCRHRVLQKFNDGTVLFADTNNRWPPIYFLPPSKVEVKEGSYINAVADFYSFEGIKKYKNRRGFEREALVLKGYRHSDFRKEYVRAIEARQWLKGDVNTKGM